MKTVLFTARSGDVVVEDTPEPLLGRGQVLVRNQYSLLSAGTERARLQTGQQSLVGKARQRPDQVKAVLQSAAQQGVAQTWQLVNDRLNMPGLMGYSCAGVAIAVAPGVDDITPGTLVACGGGGYANHAEVVAVPRNLCVPVPAGVSAADAAFATVGAIALHGIHQAAVEPGSRVVVIGLGLVGQLTARLLHAYGYAVAGVDADPAMTALATSAGIPAFTRGDDGLAEAVKGALGGRAEAVIVTAATKSADPVVLAGDLARDQATVVIVGDTGVEPPRPSYYHKELSIVYSRSYGPGRYDPRYEEGGQSYPEGFVPWDERRNLAEIVRLLATGRLRLDGLHPVVYPVEQAPAAYAHLAGGTDQERSVAILLEYPIDADAIYPENARPVGTGIALHTDRIPPGLIRVGALGAGSFATRMLFPPLKALDGVALSWLATAGGVSAFYQGRRWGFHRAVRDLDEGLATDETDAVMVLSRHDSHGRLAAEVLGRGLGLFVEKPLALDDAELERVVEAWVKGGAPAMVGFNRRFAPATVRLHEAVRGRGPLQVVYRVFAGALPPDHWYFDREQGGRIHGEVCHFVDLAGHLIGAHPVEVRAQSPDGADPVTAQSVTALITYEDGSSAAVVYGGCSPKGAPKEQIEVSGHGVAGRIDDFRTLELWGPDAGRHRFRGGSKGHGGEIEAWADVLRGRSVPGADFAASLWSTLTTMRIAASVEAGTALPVLPASPALDQVLRAPMATRAAAMAGAR